MTGITDLKLLLQSMSPKLSDQEYVFCTVSGEMSDFMQLNPLCCFIEPEGLTLILLKKTAQDANLRFDNTFKQIILTVHSSLDAVGLTAAVATKLASYDISANVVAAYYHDHIFVQECKADQAIQALQEFKQ